MLHSHWVRTIFGGDMNVIVSACIAMAALLFPHAAAGQDYPTRPVRLVAAFPPGGGVDAMSRAIAPYLQARLGQPVIVENKAGAGGTIGADHVAKATKDGYTVLVGAPGGLTAAPGLYKNLPYDPLKDLMPVTLGVRISNLVTVHPSLGVSSVQELIAKAKAQPGKVAFGSGGVGTTLHLSGELFKLLAGVDILHVPYKGSGPMLADLVSGQLPLGFTDTAALEHAKAGRLRVIAQTSRVRSALMPDIPTMVESGVPGYEAVNWFGLMLPAGTPEAIAERLNREVVAILRDREAKAKLEAMAMEPSPMTRADFQAFLVEDMKRWSEVIAKAGLKAE